MCLAAYDISEPAKLRRALRYLRSVSDGKQKSVFECRLSKSERETVLEDMQAIIDPDTDSFLLVRLNTRGECIRLGCAPLLLNPRAPLILVN